MVLALFNFHPLIRLLSFIIFAAFVSLGQISSSVLGLFLLLSVYFFSNKLPAPKAWMMVKRLRIFFISIFIMYLWFTPGQLIFPEIAYWSPTFDGLWQGLQRITALIILVLGVECLLRLTNKIALLNGLYRLALPLSWLGIDRERLVVRMLLTLEAVEPVSMGDKKIKFKMKEMKQYFFDISEQFASKFSSVKNHSAEIKTVEFDLVALPKWYQWLLPVGLLAVFISVSGY